MADQAYCEQCKQWVDSWVDCIDCELFYQEWRAICDDCWPEHACNDGTSEG